MSVSEVVVVVVVIGVNEVVVVIDVDSGDVESAVSGVVVLGVEVTSRLFRDSDNASTDASVVERVCSGTHDSGDAETDCSVSCAWVGSDDSGIVGMCLVWMKLLSECRERREEKENENKSEQIEQSK